MAKTVLPLRLTERARRGMLMTHATPGALLILTGVDGLLSGESHRPWIDVLGILAGLLLVIRLRRELKSKHSQHSGVHWYEVIAGCVVILEGVHKLHRDEWFQPGTLLMLVGLVTILIGIFHRKFEGQRRLEMDDDGFFLRTRPIRSISMKWSDLDSVKLDGTTLALTDKTKRAHSISLSRVENRADVLDAIRSYLPDESGTSI